VRWQQNYPSSNTSVPNNPVSTNATVGGIGENPDLTSVTPTNPMDAVNPMGNDGFNSNTTHYVALYDLDNFKGTKLIVQPGKKQNMSNSEDKKVLTNFNNKTSSIEYILPKGTSCELYDIVNYRGTKFTLSGTGKMEKINSLKFKSFDNKASSCKWRISN